MLQFSSLVGRAMEAANHSKNSAVEAENHVKHGASSKSLMSRRKFLGHLFCLIAVFAMSLSSCNKDKDNDTSIAYFVYDGVTYHLNIISSSWQGYYSSFYGQDFDDNHEIDFDFFHANSDTEPGTYTYSEDEYTYWGDKVDFSFQKAYIRIKSKGIEKLEIKAGSFTISRKGDDDLLFTFDFTAEDGKKVTGKAQW